jgi:nucleoid-associated protein YgaU
MKLKILGVIGYLIGVFLASNVLFGCAKKIAPVQIKSVETVWKNPVAKKEIVKAKEQIKQAYKTDIKAEIPKRIYKVRSWRKYGDCLSNIALWEYNDAFQWKKIYEANKDKIKDPDLIYIGQNLIIP